jgi:hypothetical protein
LTYSSHAQQGDAGQNVDELITDRPDQTESATVVPQGTIQLETGLLFEKDRSNGMTTSSFSIPNNLFRIGIHKNFEIRVLIAEYGYLKTSDERNDIALKGFSPLAIGTKIQLAKEKGLIPEISLLAHVTLSVGSEDFKPAKALADFRFSIAHTLSDRFSLGYNFGGEYDTNTKEFEGMYSLVLGSALYGPLGMYVEFFGDFDNSHVFDGGFTYLPRPLVQLDVSGGLGLTKAATDYYLSGGVTIRFPK